MLDETWPEIFAHSNLGGQHCDHSFDDQDLLLDAYFDVDNVVCLTNKMLEDERLECFGTEKDLAMDDDSMDENLFWAELELDGFEKPPSEASFDDILNISDVITEHFSAIELDFEGFHEKQENYPRCMVDADEVDFRTPQVLEGNFAQDEDPDGFCKRPSVNELETILDDGSGIMMEETHSESENKGELGDHEILDWSVGNSLGDEF